MGDGDEGAGVAGGDGVVTRRVLRKMLSCMGSSPVNTAGGIGPLREIA